MPYRISPYPPPRTDFRFVRLRDVTRRILWTLAVVGALTLPVLVGRLLF